jgi:nitroreductase
MTAREGWRHYCEDGLVNPVSSSGTQSVFLFKSALLNQRAEEAHRGPPNIPPLPQSFQHYRRELGGEVYGSMGIAREDKAGRAVAVMRNFEFFRAPLVGIVCMHRDLGPADALSVGMFLQTLLLALTERGLGSCVEVSVAGYPEVVRSQLAISAELSILCGLAVGYPDPDFPGNKLHIGREAVAKEVVFLDS